MPKHIILTTLLWVRQDSIGLLDLLEQLLRFCIIGILVWMGLSGRSTEGLLQFGFVGILGDSEDFVVITLVRHLRVPVHSRVLTPVLQPDV